MTADTRRIRQWRKWGVLGSIALAHACVFALLSITDARPENPPLPVIQVELFPPIVPPPPHPPTPAPTSGGGAPAAPSIVHTPPPRPVARPEVVAPPTKAPEQPLVIGAAPIAGPTPGMGQGGTGTGSGTGDGDGDGPGSGAPALILRGASQAEILPLVPQAARRARQSGRSSVSCVIRADTRLEACRVVGETPAGFGFGDAALRIVPQYFRFRPPTTASGRTVEGFRVTVFVQFGRP